jgi:hypothetical protein
MKYTYRETAIKAAAVFFTGVMLSGCGGITMSPVKRAPLKVAPYQSSLAPNKLRLLVSFEGPLPNQRLAETVWDNVRGAFIDSVESNQIGFTQNYGKMIQGTAIAGTVGGLVAATQPDYTQIVIPFGRIFEEEFQSGLSKAFPHSIPCKNIGCNDEYPQSFIPQYSVSLKVTEFKVWESPLNHLNLNAKVECKTIRVDNGRDQEFTYHAQRQVEKQSLGSIMTTSQGFIQEMNNLSNRFASELAEDILTNLQKEIRE